MKVIILLHVFLSSLHTLRVTVRHSLSRSLFSYGRCPLILTGQGWSPLIPLYLWLFFLSIHTYILISVSVVLLSLSDTRNW